MLSNESNEWEFVANGGMETSIYRCRSLNLIKKKATNLQLILHERSILLCVADLNIIECKGFCALEKCLFLEDGGNDMFTMVLEGHYKDSSDVEFAFKQMKDAVSHCHALMIAHRDIKLENFLTRDCVVKLCDFNLSIRCLSYSETRYDAVGSITYAAPEVLKRSYNPFFADVWSLGICLFIMVSGYAPFKKARQSDQTFDFIQKLQCQDSDICILASIRKHHRNVAISNVSCLVSRTINEFMQVDECKRPCLQKYNFTDQYRFERSATKVFSETE